MHPAQIILLAKHIGSSCLIAKVFGFSCRSRDMSED